MGRDIAVTLLSGGLDSCVSAAVARERYDLAALHVNYAQRTSTREQGAFEQIADFYSIERRLVVDMGHFRDIGGSSLVDPALPIADAEETGVPNTYVPFRNGNLLAVAVTWAEAIGGAAVFIGAHEQETLYPDCTCAFFDAFRRAVACGTARTPAISVETPLIRLNKREIVELGARSGAPLHLTWSCYQSERIPCGICHSCSLRVRGFAEAGISDPVVDLRPAQSQ